MRTIEDIDEQAEALRAAHSERDELYDKMERMVFLNSDDAEEVKGRAANVKYTVSPEPGNKLYGAVRLFSSTTEKFRVPSKSFDQRSSNIERFCQATWFNSSRLSGVPHLYDLGFSALLYGEVHLGITYTPDLLEAMKKKGGAYEKRAKRASDITPFMFQAFNPLTCYTDCDLLGLTMHYRRVETTARAVKGDWGKAGEAALGELSNQDTVILKEVWDLEQHSVYLEGGGTIMNKEHELPSIPIRFAITDGSVSLFKNKVAYQRRPLLYAVAQSGLWDRQNLSLSAMYTLIFGLGFSPLFVYTTNTEGKHVTFDLSQPMNVAEISTGESLVPLPKGIVDPSVQMGMQMASDMISSSTMYDVAFGSPLGNQVAYSTVALLNQAGRLPLVSPQKRLEWLLGNTMMDCLERLKHEGKDGKARWQNETLDLVISELGEDIPQIEAILDVKLPQDKMQMGQVALAMKQAGILSDEFIQSNFLDVEQPEDMRSQVWSERAKEALYAQFIQERMAEIQEAEAKRKALAEAEEKARQGPPPGMQPGGQQPALTPEAMAQMAGSAAAPGLEPAQPVPPAPPMGGPINAG